MTAQKGYIIVRNDKGVSVAEEMETALLSYTKTYGVDALRLSVQVAVDEYLKSLQDCPNDDTEECLAGSLARHLSTLRWKS